MFLGETQALCSHDGLFSRETLMQGQGAAWKCGPANGTLDEAGSTRRRSAASDSLTRCTDDV